MPIVGLIETPEETSRIHRPIRARRHRRGPCRVRTNMRLTTVSLGTSLALAFGLLASHFGHGAGHHAPAAQGRVDFSFEGPFGTYDRGALQRGFQVYKEVCSACHSAQHLAFHNLDEPGGPEFTEAQAKALAAGRQGSGRSQRQGRDSRRQGRAPDASGDPGRSFPRRPSRTRRRPAPTMAARCRPTFPWWSRRAKAARNMSIRS